MADNNEDLMAEFQEFLTAKRERDAANAQEEDYEVEVWNEKGQGARLRRSHAKPFLQSLGIDVDPPQSDGNSGESGDGNTGDKKSAGRKSSGSQSNATGSQSVARKYFVKAPPAGTK